MSEMLVGVSIHHGRVGPLHIDTLSGGLIASKRTIWDHSRAREVVFHRNLVPWQWTKLRNPCFVLWEWRLKNIVRPQAKILAKSKTSNIPANF